MFAGTGGYRKLRTRQIALPRNAAQLFGIRAALTAEPGRHVSRRDVAAGERQEIIDEARVSATAERNEYLRMVSLVPQSSVLQILANREK
jgi:hypothetical protein